LNIINTPIPDLIVIEPDIYSDERGYFFESYNAQKWPASLPKEWVQDNESKSQRGVLRGLHYQTNSMGQAKLVRAIVGDIFDVAVDIRPDSTAY
jgi:dTDP-4-dehydrorhamnose 3,5-epimerase